MKSSLSLLSGTVVLCAAIVAGAPSGAGEKSKPPDLLGEWFVAEGAELQDPQNPSSFTVTKVVAEPQQYSDGYFLFKWKGDPGLTRGWYSNKGRVWFNTPRFYAGARISAQYSGRLHSGKTLQLQGSAAKIQGAEKIEWHFTATRQKPG